MPELNPKSQPPPPGEVLLIDDNPDNLTLLSQMLTGAGYKVRSFPDGRMAMQSALRQEPEIILLDINMPAMDGYEVCRLLKAEGRLRDIPVIFISALNEVFDKVKAFQVGGVDYIAKPFQFEEVRMRVETHLRLRRMQAEIHAQHQQLDASFQALKKLQALRDDLIHMVVHDMRSPLMAICGNVELVERLAGGQLGERELGMLTSAQCGAALLVELVNSLLDVHRIESGKFPLQIAPCMLADVVDEALKPLAFFTQMRKIEWAPQPANPIQCDGVIIRRVIGNLIYNAIKHTPKTAAIRITVTQQADEALVEVIDAGPGIAPEHREAIFEKFGQVESKHRGRGSGLGLTFCKLAVESHGGRIGLTSVLGQGSTFYFRLPTRQAQATAAQGT